MFLIYCNIESFRWHRIGVTVKGDSITLVLDCVHQVTRKFDRGLESIISTNGLILSGRQLNEEEEFFIGDIQLLLIANSPDEAYHICSKYAPDCPNGQTNLLSKNTNNHGSASKSTISRSSSRISSTRGNNKKKKQNTTKLYDVDSSDDVVGQSYLTNQNEQLIKINSVSTSQASHSSINTLDGHYNGREETKVLSQSNQTENISAPRNLKKSSGSIAKFEKDSASYSDDYFDSIDESFYDEGDSSRTSANVTNERIGKTFLLNIIRSKCIQMYISMSVCLHGAIKYTKIVLIW